MSLMVAVGMYQPCWSCVAVEIAYHVDPVSSGWSSRPQMGVCQEEPVLCSGTQARENRFIQTAVGVWQCTSRSAGFLKVSVSTLLLREKFVQVGYC